MSGKQSKSLLPIVWQTALLALSLTSLSHGQTTALTFRPVGAEYSPALDRIIMISSNPNLLHIYDPSSNADTTVRLSNAPLNFSVGPDGLHAAVAYTASVDYINLQSAAVERNYLVPVSTGSPVIGDYRIGNVVLGTTYFYILSSGNSGLAISVNLSSGAVTTRGNAILFNGRYNSAINAIYAVQQYGYNLVRYDVSTGPISGAINSPYSVAPGLRFVSMTPCRVVDTGLSAGAFGGPALTGQTSRDFALSAGPCGIPSTALAYSLNVTAVPHGPLSYMTIWPTANTRPTVSTLNSYDGRIRANAAIIPAGQGGSISAFATNDTEIILDVNGYFVQDSSALVYYPLTACRVADTREGTGDLGGPALSGGQERTLPLRTSACNIPAEAQAYSLNYTVVPKQSLGYLTSWPTGQSRPVASTLNAPTGAVTANAAVVPAGTNGSVDVFASDDTDLVIDINGYFAPPGNGGLSLYAVTPCRVFDTRTTGNGQPFNGALDVNVKGSECKLPANVQAYALNATVIPSEHLGYLSLWPSGAKQPLVSTLNSQDGAVTANMAVITTQGGSVSSFVTDTTHLILDVTGYFAP